MRSLSGELRGGDAAGRTLTLSLSLKEGTS